MKWTVWSVAALFVALAGFSIGRDWFLMRYFSESDGFIGGLFLSTALWPLAIWGLVYAFLKLRREVQH